MPLRPLIMAVACRGHPAATEGHQPIVGFAFLGMAVPPQYELFQNEEQQNAEQHGSGHFRGIFRQLERFWQSIKEGCP